jgi:4-aminobutyrate aminotransferase-like enzyme/Ser/Thr protein kinase RdoA (MazF antagonist)
VERSRSRALCLRWRPRQRSAGQRGGLQLNPETTPRFAIHDAERLAAQHYALTARARPLPSERDQNFALESADGSRYILKIAKSDEERAVLDFQNQALRHLAVRVSTVETPALVAAQDGTDMVTARDATGRSYLLRLVTWLNGELLATVCPREPKLQASLGRSLAEVDEALDDFSHEAMHRELYWDLRHVDFALQYLPLLSAEQQALVAHFTSRWQAVPWQKLRLRPIHGDINDYNVLVRSGRVSGFIDFGDMVHSALAGDLAIALAYAMLEQEEPLAVAATIVSAYHERYPLEEAEIAALFPLLVARLCMTVCYSAHNAVAKQGDDYQLVHAHPAWRLLEHLRAQPFESVQARIREACGGRARVLAARRRLFGGNLSLSYAEPLQLVRGSMQYLYDEGGRRYLDAYNNVPHVGHCHPAVVRAAAQQMAQLNTNTRYLNEQVHAFAQQLVATLPGALKVCYFVNSGSEANELALRLARAHTGQQDLLVLEQAYHGCTTTLVDISPYKQGNASLRTPPWVHIAPLPDQYRGAYKRGDPSCGQRYARSADEILERLREAGVKPAGFIAESWPSVAGQMDLPPGYLPAVYRSVRAAGGVCIADEVQTAYGRLGRHFWGFEAYGVTPDIVVMGKPIGNGHPVAAVVTTPDIAASFDNGIEFFSTFGGNTVSCAIALKVLEVVAEENRQAQALTVGGQLLAGLRALQARHPLIGDVRGSGFFLGVELVRDRETLEPAGSETTAVLNFMRRLGVLIGSEGEFHNVLKIRPPMPFEAADAQLLLETLGEALQRAECL